MNDNRRAMLIRDFISVWRDLDFVGVSSEDISIASGLSLRELRHFIKEDREISTDRIHAALQGCEDWQESRLKLKRNLS